MVECLVLSLTDSYEDVHRVFVVASRWEDLDFELKQFCEIETWPILMRKDVGNCALFAQ